MRSSKHCSIQHFCIKRKHTFISEGSVAIRHLVFVSPWGPSVRSMIFPACTSPSGNGAIPPALWDATPHASAVALIRSLSSWSFDMTSCTATSRGDSTGTSGGGTANGTAGGAACTGGSCPASSLLSPALERATAMAVDAVSCPSAGGLHRRGILNPACSLLPSLASCERVGGLGPYRSSGPP